MVKPEDKTKEVPESSEDKFDEAVCSAEFGNEGCKDPDDSVSKEKSI